jgi:phospholipid transport system substrate-binding protein
MPLARLVCPAASRRYKADGGTPLPLGTAPFMIRINLKQRFTLLLSSILLAGIWVMAARGETDGTDRAVRQVRTFYDALLATMKEGDRLGIHGRYEKLAPVIRETFDLSAMTRIAVGPDWRSIAPEQQSELIESFTRMTIATYASRFDGYSGERFEVEPTSEERNTGRLVRSKLIPSSGEPVTLNYLMRSSGGPWKIVDVYLTGTISELATRRSEFAAILKSGGPNALIESLRQQGEKPMRTSGTKTETGKR